MFVLASGRCSFVSTAADRLVELVEERRGPVPADEAARLVLKLEQRRAGRARAVAARRGGARRRAASLGGRPRRARRRARRGARARAGDVRRLRPRDDRPPARDGAAVRDRRGARARARAEERFQTLANPGARLQPAIAALTGLRDAELRRAPPVAAGVRRFLGFAGDAVLVAHNARFDMAFLDNETMRLTGRRVAATVVDTVGLARRLLGRQPANLAALSYRFATDARPCHRALPDAEATAEILLCLIGMAQERGARTVADLVELAATRPRRVHRKRQPRVRRAAASRRLPLPRRARPGALRRHARATSAPGCARTSAPSGSGPRSKRRSARSSASSGATRGSELEAALEELRLIRELRPPANARSARPDRYVYLRRRGDSRRLLVAARPSSGRSRAAHAAQLAARALQGVEWETLDDALPKLRTKLKRLARDLRFEDAARLARPHRGARGRRRARSTACGGCVSWQVCLVAPGRAGGTRGGLSTSRRARSSASRPFTGAERARMAGGPRGRRARRADARARGRRRPPRPRVVHPPAAARAGGDPRWHTCSVEQLRERALGDGWRKLVVDGVTATPVTLERGPAVKVVDGPRTETVPRERVA